MSTSQSKWAGWLVVVLTLLVGISTAKQSSSADLVTLTQSGQSGKQAHSIPANGFATSSHRQASADNKPASKSSGTGAATPAEIAAAKASHKVWVNLDSGIYHKSGRWYGKTKNGKFMTESEAKASGYRKSKRN